MAGTAADGLAAIELAESLDPDAVMIDLHMPLLDGVSARSPDCGAITRACLTALTGDDTQRIHDAVREAGADAVVAKEDFLGTLIDRLRAVGTA